MGAKNNRPLGEWLCPLRTIGVIRIGLAAWVRASLAELTGRVEPVDLLDQRFNFLPRSFRWRGDLWRVRSIVRVWEQPRVGWRSMRIAMSPPGSPG